MTPRRRAVAAYEHAVLLATSVVPLVAGARGRLNADTKQYLYLDPGGLMTRARSLWDPSVGGGTITHQTIGYLWPMGPYYRLAHAVGLPDWAAQRIWIGLIQFAAGLGALVLIRAVMAPHRAQLVGALAYGLSPFVLGHVTGQSALLLPFSALPWLLWCVMRAVEQPGWRWPARFALIVTTVGSLNGSSVFFALFFACLWIPYLVWSQRTLTLRAGAITLVRLGSLTAACQLWWLTAYAVGGKFGLPILAVTENVQATNNTTSASEIVRGLGYWFFYGGDPNRSWLDGLAPPYLQSRVLLAVTFAVPVLALAAAALVRFPHRGFFALAATIATVVAVGAFPVPRRSLYGALFESASRRSNLVLSLRNTQRAAPMTALAFAVFLAAALSLVSRHHARTGAAVAAALAVIVAGALPAQWRTGLIADRFHRDDVPTYWYDAARALDAGTGRVLEIPGIDFAAYRWGNTLDPVSPGLTDRPILARELVPMGAAPGISLFDALDRTLQEGTFEPATLAPVARLLGANHILVRSDLEYERYRTARPELTWALISRAGLGTPQVFGPALPNRAAAITPLLDEIALGAPALATPPEVALFAVPGTPTTLVSIRAVGGGYVIDGDGDGIVAAAAASLVDPDAGIVLYGASVGLDPTLVPAGARFIITDSNRKQAGRWYALRDNVGAIEPADQRAVLDDPSDARLPIVDGMPVAAQSIAEWRGAARVWASAYGGPYTLAPEERPVNAFDGDPRTAWRVDTIGYHAPWEIGIDIGRRVDAGDVVVRNPVNRPGTKNVTRVQITLDGTRVLERTLDANPPGGAQSVALDGAPFQTFALRILDATSLDGSAGFAEIEIPGVRVDEYVALPTIVGKLVSGNTPTALVLTRQRANPAEPVRSDPELALRRVVELASPLTFTLSGTVRLETAADEDVVDKLIGLISSDVESVRSTEHLAGALADRASAALDGNPDTAWTTPFVGVRNQQWRARFTHPVTLPALDLSLVDDNVHSSIRRLTVTVGDNPPVTLDVPASEPGPAGTTRRVVLPFDRPLTGTSLTLRIDAYDARTTPDWYSAKLLDLPAAIAEVTVPGVRPLRTVTPASVCRDDLVAIGGRPVSVRVTGDTLESCQGPIRLAAGRTDITTAAGLDTGLDLDRLVLTTADFATAPTRSPAIAADVGSHDATSARATVRTDGTPFWLVLDQSYNRGWSLEIPGAQVRGPFPVNSFANGWIVTPTAPGTLDVAIDWTPQHRVNRALAVSLAAVAVAVVLALRPTGRRPRTHDPLPAPDLAPTPPALTWATIVAAGAAFAVFGPAPAAPIAVAVLALARRRPGLRRALPLVPALLVAAAGLQTLWFQSRDHYEARGNWARHFGVAHVFALSAMLLLAFVVRSPAADGEK